MMPPVRILPDPPSRFIIVRFLAFAMLIAAIGLALPAASPLARPSAAQLRALTLPATPIDATTDGAPRPLVFRSLRLSSSAEKVVLFSGEDSAEEISEGRKLGMSFEATARFDGVGAFLANSGAGGSLALVALMDATGREVGKASIAVDEHRHWIDLAVPSQPPGRYTLEISKQGPGRLSWISKVGKGPEQALLVEQSGRIAFQPGPVPQYANTTYSIPVGLRATALYFLGGLSSYDHGMSWWDDYEARGDYGDRQLIGDSAGKVEVVYDDGSIDAIPLIFGWNLWWFNHFDGPEAGGPFLEPFLSDASARDTLVASLRLANFSPDPAARYFWTYLPRPKKIAELRLVDNPQKQGFPLFYAISVLTDGRSGNLADGDLGPAPGSPSAGKVAPIAPYDLATSSYRTPTESLRRLLYTSRQSLPLSLPKERASLTPQIEFYGPVEADILSNVYTVNLPDLLDKQEDNGKFHASSKGSVNWGSYQGIGTWRPDAAPFYAQSWARDMGRALLEFSRLGFLAKAEAGVKFSDSRLNDLPGGYPAINRAGQKVPPHWTTVLGEPLYGDKDGQGDGDQANDGHGLLLLAHYRLWQQKGRDTAWLEDRWPFVRDAAQWFVFQLDNPSFSRATDVLYTESESARDGGYDVYSNFIALKGLEKSAEMADSLGEAGTAGLWRQYAARLRRGMLDRLTVNDPAYGKTWKPVAWNWSYAHESLGPLLLSADVDGFDGESMDPELLAISLNTYRRQASLPGGLATPQTMGYGQSFLTQAALLADDVDAYTTAVNNLARFIYYPRHMPYLVPEGVTLHPSGEYWYRNGDLGNAVHQAEVLKTLSIVAGVDNLRSGRVGVVPRLPDGWTGLRVVDYPVNDGKSKLTFALTRRPNAYQMTLKPGGESIDLDLRVGPLPVTATDVRATVDGETSRPAMVRAGSRLWVRIGKLAGESGKEIDVRIEWKGD